MLWIPNSDFQIVDLLGKCQSLLSLCFPKPYGFIEFAFQICCFGVLFAEYQSRRAGHPVFELDAGLQKKRAIFQFKKMSRNSLEMAFIHNWKIRERIHLKESKSSHSQKKWGCLADYSIKWASCESQDYRLCDDLCAFDSAVSVWVPHAVLFMGFSLFSLLCRSSNSRFCSSAEDEQRLSARLFGGWNHFKGLFNQNQLNTIPSERHWSCWDASFEEFHEWCGQQYVAVWLIDSLENLEKVDAFWFKVQNLNLRFFGEERPKHKRDHINTFGWDNHEDSSLRSQ